MLASEMADKIVGYIMGKTRNTSSKTLYNSTTQLSHLYNTPTLTLRGYYTV